MRTGSTVRALRCIMAFFLLAGCLGQSCLQLLSDDDEVVLSAPPPKMAPLRFDFGLADSAVEPGYLAVLPTTVYDPTTGLGWQTLDVSGADRADGTSLSKDLNYGQDMTFVIDVPTGVYTVTLTVGDTSRYPHDEIAVILEADHVETVSTAAFEVKTLTYEGVVVNDGQLTVQMTDLGGSDVNAVINALDVIWTGPDAVGPRVIAAEPAGTVVGSIDQILVTFDEPVDPSSFTVADVVDLTGPSGAIDPIAIIVISVTQFEVLFAEQTVPGVYTLAIGPDILDLAGNPMDQDGNGTGGEPQADAFTTQVDLIVFSKRFDFGTASSPVADGYLPVTATSFYAPTVGYGWVTDTVLSVNRTSGTALERDLNYGVDYVFVVDLPNGVYTVTLTVGDTGAYPHDEMAVILEEAQLDTVSTSAYEVKTLTYEGVVVNDGQLTVKMTNLGGTDGNAVINALDVILTGPEMTEPVAPEPDIISGTPTATAVQMCGSAIEGESFLFTLGVLGPRDFLPQIRVLTPPQHGLLGSAYVSDSGALRIGYLPETGFLGVDEFQISTRDNAGSERRYTLIVVVNQSFSPENSRPLLWAPKTSRVLYSDDEIATARLRCDSDLAAGDIRQSILDRAEYWAQLSDQELHDLLPDHRVPRAFNVSAKGCPICGTDIYQYGPYPWILDRERPFSLTCPSCGETFDNAGFEAYYRGGMTNPCLVTGPYADYGRGWTAPDGERYWLVAYACHWNWRLNWLPAIRDLSQAYTLTNDALYARKAIVMLDRIADIYPGMDYSRQSRYGELRNGKYHGKIVNGIWETYTLRELATAYDLVFDALIGPNAVSLPWRSPDQIRARIEADILEEGIEAVSRGQIQGNFGMHQNALARTAIVRQNGPVEDLLASILDMTGGAAADEGLNYALYNLVSKDGMPNETSPYYNFLQVANYVEIAQALKGSNIDLFSLPRMRLAFDAPLSLVCLSSFTPAIGDAGSLDAGWIGATGDVYASLYRELGVPQYAWAMEQLGWLEGSDFRQFTDLFVDAILADAAQDAAAVTHRPPSRLLDGYGVGILNNDQDNVAASLYFGPRHIHGHYDQLNIELFGHGYRLSPDLGYPDFMNAYIPGVYSWSKNTISHNCVMVDEQKQPGQGPGTVLRFHDSPTVDVIDVDAADTYDQTSRYQRTLVLIETGVDSAYFIDVFRVQGGANHVLSLHGPEGAFEFSDTAMPAPITSGTLAGTDVSYGELYDDPVLSAPDYDGDYYGYSGSGYQHLFNWQAAFPTGIVTGNWYLADDPDIGLRIHVLPAAGQEIVLADAYVSPLLKVPTVLKYMLARRTANSAGNTFVTVWEPVQSVPMIDDIVMHDDPSLGVGHGQHVVLSVYRGDTVDTIAIAGEDEDTFTAGPIVASDAAVAVVTEQAGQWVRAFAAGGTAVTGSRPGQTLTVPAPIVGTVVDVNYNQKLVEIAVDSDPGDVTILEGQRIRISNSDHSCMHQILSAEVDGDFLRLELTGADLLTGRVHLVYVDAATPFVSTNTPVHSASNLVGMRLLSSQLGPAGAIREFSDGMIHLDTSVTEMATLQTLEANQDAWIADFGPGDSVEIEVFAHE